MNENKIILSEESKDFEKIKEEWFNKARYIQTFEELNEFGNHLFNDYIHDYGTAVRAVSALTIAAAWLGTHLEGLTGFQAGFIKWDFMHNYDGIGSKCGIKLLNYDDMLYPQNEYGFNKEMCRSMFLKIQEEAVKLMENTPRDLVNDKVWQHWESIVAGNVPFGWSISEVDD